MRSIRAKLDRLESAANEQAAASDTRWNNRRWLELFEQPRLSAIMAKYEPDWLAALEMFRSAIEEEESGADLQHEIPTLEYTWDLATGKWREHSWSSKTRAAWTWLAEMAERMRNDGPRTSQREYTALAQWFAENQDRLAQIARQTNSVLDLGNGKCETITNIEWQIASGPRAHGAGKVAHMMRRLVARYGEPAISDWMREVLEKMEKSSE